MIGSGSKAKSGLPIEQRVNRASRTPTEIAQMARVVLAAFCQSAIVDRTTNNLSIINQLDELHPPPPPDRAQRGKGGVVRMAFQCALVSVWEREKPQISEAAPLRIRIVTPGKKSIDIAQGTIDLRKHRRARSVIQMPGLPIDGEGRYVFIYEVRRGNTWKRTVDVPLLITFAAVGRKTTH